LLLGSVLCQKPSGSYCGENKDLNLRVAIRVLDDKSVQIVVNIAGDNKGCLKEDYMYNAVTHKIDFPNLSSASDCLAGLLSEYEIDPSSLSIEYDPATNTLIGSADGISVKFGQCTPPPMYRDGPGAYCGHIEDTLKVKATVLVFNNTIALAGKFNGKIFSCPNEKYYILDNNSVILPGSYVKSDCLGAIFNDNQIDPSTVNIVYDPKGDTATITGPRDFTLSVQSCAAHMITADPSGTYCGSYDDIVSVKVKVDSLQSIDLSASIFGFATTCNGEAVKYNTTGPIHDVSFPNINNANDCVAKTLSSYGLSPSQLEVQYDEPRDVIFAVIKSLSVNITFTKKCSFRKYEEIDLKLLEQLKGTQ